METIRSLFQHKVDRTIEEVIKVDQHDQQTVLTELNEYIVTDSICDHFRTVYDEIVQVKNNPREGIGVWVSGFFGSGKSSFAKILGYTVAARPVLGKSASEIFKQTVQDAKISGLLDIINQTIPSEAVIFDVSMDRGVRTANERISEIMYKALLRELDYAQDFDLAELEYTLEGDGKLEDFVERFQRMHDQPWSKRRKLGLAINEASAVLNEIEPKTYPQPDSYARSIGSGRADISPNKLADRAFELAERRRSGKALIFVIDEVGRYVARSQDKMVDLQGVLQAFGAQGKNRVVQKKAVAPFWIVVTSQEKLNEIVDALDSKRVDLATLQDRFRVTIDLKQSDIAEITGERVLKKRDDKTEALESLFQANEGRMKAFCTLKRTPPDVSISSAEFVRLYPYLPYQIDVCIDIVSGLRLKRGTQRHIGGSNRTIIKQAQEMLINPRTMLADQPIGALVTLDKVYELLYLGNLLPSETTREVDEVPKTLPGNDMAAKVAKAIALLEAVKNLPRTVHNISVVLHPSVESDSIKKDVEEAIRVLADGQVIRDSEEGYKLLTVQEKSWDTTRRGLDPKPADRNRIIRDTFRGIFSEPKLRTYRYKNLKSFKVSLSVQGESVEPDGEIPLNMLIAEEPEDWGERSKEARENSTAGQNEVFWAFTLNEEIHRRLLELYRSQEMVGTHERLAAKGSMSSELHSCLSEEKVRRDRYQRELRNKMVEALHSGAGFFRGVQKDGSALGSSFSEALHKLLDDVIPAVYPKLEMGISRLKEKEAEAFLKAANLNGLPQVFYDGENGLSLVTKQGDKFVPNVSADICKEILAHLVREHKYGNKIMGKMIESHFRGIGYGWDLDVIQLVLAVLLRGGAVELTHQGRKYRAHDDPAVRDSFTKIPAFRAASFAPREPIDLRTLTRAARRFEEITGQEIGIEEGTIAMALKELAAADREDLLPVLARMNAFKLPGVEYLENHRKALESIVGSPPDDCVRTLAGEGNTYKEARIRISELLEATSDTNLQTIENARNSLRVLWPVMDRHGAGEEVEAAAKDLAALVESESFYNSIEALRQASERITDAYWDLYTQIHEERTSRFTEALEFVKGMDEYVTVCENPAVTETDREVILQPLVQRACHTLDLPAGEVSCRNCGATVDQMETDTSVADAIRDGVTRKVQELAAPEDKDKIERVRVSNLLAGKLETQEDVEEAVRKLKEYLLKLVAGGKKVLLE